MLWTNFIVRLPCAKLALNLLISMRTNCRTTDTDFPSAAFLTKRMFSTPGQRATSYCACVRRSKLPRTDQTQRIQAFYEARYFPEGEIRLDMSYTAVKSQSCPPGSSYCNLPDDAPTNSVMTRQLVATTVPISVLTTTPKHQTDTFRDTIIDIAALTITFALMAGMIALGVMCGGGDAEKVPATFALRAIEAMRAAVMMTWRTMVWAWEPKESLARETKGMSFQTTLDKVLDSTLDGALARH